MHGPTLEAACRTSSTPTPACEKVWDNCRQIARDVLVSQATPPLHIHAIPEQTHDRSGRTAEQGNRRNISRRQRTDARLVACPGPRTAQPQDRRQAVLAQDRLRRVAERPAHRNSTRRRAVTATRLYRRSPLYIMSYQGHWEEQVYQTELPLWTRVYALAMARSEPNLHTRIGEAELAVLGKARPDGTRNPVDRRRFWEAIQRLT
ncbi:MAG: hypothetical protein QOG14_3918, partial [Mycobacterium sp.]|nr:hypothetical protein [Mycobacterium sp.]